MSTWTAKRFWENAQVTRLGDLYTVQLDGKAVKTPAKSDFALPTESLAKAAAAEWQAQDGKIDPTTMPVTRAANAAIDKVAHQFDEVAQMLADYGDSDLTCYRAAEPAGLVAAQNTAWEPLLDWAAERYAARLTPAQGVLHVPQQKQALASLSQPLFNATNFELTALHDLISLSGSLVIGLAASEQAFDIDDLWMRSRVDEEWQISQWGKDEEAEEQAEIKRQAFFAADRFLRLTRETA